MYTMHTNLIWHLQLYVLPGLRNWEIDHLRFDFHLPKHLFNHCIAQRYINTNTYHAMTNLIGL